MVKVMLGEGAGGSLTFEDPTRGSDGELWWVVATVEAPGLRASTRLETHYATYFDDLIAYLDDLAASWRGWEGAKTWASLEQDLAIAATHDGVGHVLLAVTLQGPHPPYAWTVDAHIVVEPGAQLERAAAEARGVLERRV